MVHLLKLLANLLMIRKIVNLFNVQIEYALKLEPAEPNLTLICTSY